MISGGIIDTMVEVTQKSVCGKVLLPGGSLGQKAMLKGRHSRDFSAQHPESKKMNIETPTLEKAGFTFGAIRGDRCFSLMLMGWPRVMAHSILLGGSHFV